MQAPLINQVPQVVMMVPANPYAFMNSLQKLANVHGVFIKQKPQFLEQLTGCEQSNVYNVYASSADGEITKAVSLFKCKEKSDCCERQCLSADCRPFMMKVTHDTDDNQGNDDQLAMIFEREYQCTFFCLNRPVMKVFMADQGQKRFLGYVQNPFTCCVLKQMIYNDKEELVYQLQGTCCQLGVICPLPCGDCQIVNFEILDRHGNEIGKFQKKKSGCLKAAFSNADNFSMVFPPLSTPEERAVLTAAIIMMDYQYFEEKHDDKHHH